LLTPWKLPGGRRIDPFEDHTAIPVAPNVEAILILQTSIDARLLRKRHSSLLIDETLPALPSRPLVLGWLKAGARPKWGRQDSNLRRLSRTIYSRHPLTAWILPRPRRFYRPALSINELANGARGFDFKL
jgi:hypothetical protein